MIANFFLNFILHGLILSSGLFYSAILKSWDTDRLHAMMPFAVNIGVSNIIGSFSEKMVKKTEQKSIIFWGSLLCATAIGICCLENDINWLIAFWGILFGIAHGIIVPYLNKDLDCCKDYQKVIYKCCPNIGCIILAFALPLLFSCYEVSGSFLISSGIVLNYLPLTLLAVYKISFVWKTSKWLVRKRSSKYKINRGSEKNTMEAKTIKHFNKNEIVASCLESDTTDYEDQDFQNVPGIHGNFEEKMEKKSTYKNISDKKRTDLEPKIYKKRKIPPIPLKLASIIPEIEKYENDRMVFEGSFSEEDIVKNVVCQEIDQNPVKENGCQNNLEDDNSVTGPPTNDFDVAGNVMISETKVPEIKITPDSTSTSKQDLQDLDADEVNLAITKNIKPISIKVDVIECTFDNETQYMHYNKNYNTKRKSNYRNHSNSLITQCYDHIDFTKQSPCKLTETKPRCFSRQCDNIYSISETVEIENKSLPSNKNTIFNKETNKPQLLLTEKLKTALKTLLLIVNLRSLIIIMINIIYEFSLLALILLFADFSRDIKIEEYFQWILAAFGTGGILGNIFFSYFIKNIQLSTSTTSSVLFVLNSFAVLGILWSKSLKWLINFYFILGVLESCIHATLSTINLSYTSTESQLLSSASKFMHGILAITLPCFINSTRDKFGNYEAFLQAISCCSILCAIFCLILSKLK